MNKSVGTPFSQQPPNVHQRANAEPDMCDKCIELDKKIEQYRRQSRSTTDQPTIDRLKELIGDLVEQKIALHTKPAK